MRALRILAASVWYFVCTAVNNREPLFWSALERARFMRVLNEARKRYVFELRGLRFCGPWVSFYIKPADGLQLPEIMQWIKQTYAVRYNVHDGRTGHIWGDRVPVGDRGGVAGRRGGVCVCGGALESGAGSAEARGGERWRRLGGRSGDGR
ncbi:MAG: hypothetical protein LBK61_01945 [Spirochaetaceae bacterium]|nr:hypothetical protein [Spirochaetaceae bacterium]